MRGSVKLGTTGSPFSNTTSNQDQFRGSQPHLNKDEKSVTSFLAHNVKSSHFDIGPGGKLVNSETHDRYQKYSLKER